MQVRLLGPVDVVVDGESRPVHGLRRKAVLAALALHHGEVVSTGHLVDAVWGTAAPATATATLQNHVSYLRRVLGSKTAVRARPPGYLLDLGIDGTDVQLAERLLREGTQSADPVLAVRQLQAALGLWRGRPLADLATLPWLEEQAGRLDLLGTRVKQALAEARLAAGEHAALVPDLEQMAADRPLDEQIHAQLMRRCTAAAGRLTRLPSTSGYARPWARTWDSIPASGCATWKRPSCGRIWPSTRPRRRRPRPRCRRLRSCRRLSLVSPGVARSWPGSTRCSPRQRQPTRPSPQRW